MDRDSSEWQDGYEWGLDDGRSEGYEEGFSDGKDEAKECVNCISDLQREIEMADKNPRYIVKVTELIKKYRKVDLSKNDALNELENELDIFLQCGV